MMGYYCLPIQPEGFEQGYDAKERLFPLGVPEGFSESISLLTTLFNEKKKRKLFLGDLARAMIAAHMALSGLQSLPHCYYFGSIFIKEQWDQQVPQIVFLYFKVMVRRSSFALFPPSD